MAKRSTGFGEYAAVREAPEVDLTKNTVQPQKRAAKAFLPPSLILVDLELAIGQSKWYGQSLFQYT